MASTWGNEHCGQFGQTGKPLGIPAAVGKMSIMSVQVNQMVIGSFPTSHRFHIEKRPPSILDLLVDHRHNPTKYLLFTVPPAKVPVRCDVCSYI